MECGQREALVQRHEKEGFEVDFDAWIFVFDASVEHHLGLSATTVRNILFD